MKRTCLWGIIGVMTIGFIGCSNPPQPPPDPLATIIPQEPVHHANELDVPPRLLQWDGSLYAPTLARNGVSATATFEFVVSSEGMVHSVNVLRATHLDAANQILDVLPRWSFSPGMIGGQPVASRVTKSLTFSPGAPAEPIGF